MGSHEHGGEEPGAAAGINRVPVTFTVASGNGTLRLVSSDAGADSITVITSTFTITNQEISDPGVASVIWTPPTAPGTYTLTATGPATGGPVTFTATVPAPPPLNFIQLAATERRMLSMQTGASIPIKVVPDQFGTVWLSSDATKIQVSPIVTDGRFSRVTAIIGGENIAGGADASLTSVLITGNPGPSLLVNSFAFDIFPRTTTLVWNAVAGAVSYEVVTEFGNASATDPFCTVPADCGLWTVQVAGSTVTSSLTFTFDFVGSQPGRWRVFARNAAGVIISTSAYVYFDYDV